MRSGPRRRAALAAGLLALLCGCGVPLDERPRALDTESAPYQVIGRDPEPPAAGAERATVYLFRDQQVVPVVRRTTSEPDAGLLLQALLAGPTPGERLRGLSTAVPPNAAVSGPTRDGVLTVELPAEADDQGLRTDEVLGYAQLVLTLTRDPRVSSVVFERDGKLLAVPRGDGSIAGGPLTRRDYASLL